MLVVVVPVATVIVGVDVSFSGESPFWVGDGVPSGIGLEGDVAFPIVPVNTPVRVATVSVCVATVSVCVATVSVCVATVSVCVATVSVCVVVVLVATVTVGVESSLAEESASAVSDGISVKETVPLTPPPVTFATTPVFATVSFFSNVTVDEAAEGAEASASTLASASTPFLVALELGDAAEDASLVLITVDV